MERLGNRRLEDFPPTTLYLEDLEEIVGILAAACKRIEVTASDYKITDPKEVEALAGKFSSGRFDGITLQGYEPYVSVDLRTYGVSAYMSNDSVEQRGIIARIGDVIAKGKKIKADWFYGPLTVVTVGGGTLALLEKQFTVGLLLLVALLVILPFNVKKRMKDTVIVHTHRRGSVKSFFERKKDDLGLAAISAVLGGAITYLIAKYLA